MSTKSIKLYNVLVDLNVDREVAAEALEPILTKDEAFQVLATKDDLHHRTKWIVSTFIEAALQEWLIRVGIKPIQTYPGSPWENGYNGRFNGPLRCEVLNAEWFTTNKQAQTVINQWLKQYNYIRPHQAPTSGAEHAPSSSRNSIKKWHITRGLYSAKKVSKHSCRSTTKALKNRTNCNPLSLVYCTLDSDAKSSKHLHHVAFRCFAAWQANACNCREGPDHKIPALKRFNQTVKGRWIRMIAIPIRSSAPKAFLEFEERGQAQPADA